MPASIVTDGYTEYIYTPSQKAPTPLLLLTKIFKLFNIFKLTLP
jgi:hypothetical protein